MKAEIKSNPGDSQDNLRRSLSLNLQCGCVTLPAVVTDNREPKTAVGKPSRGMADSNALRKFVSTKFLKKEKLRKPFACRSASH